MGAHPYGRAGAPDDRSDSRTGPDVAGGRRRRRPAHGRLLVPPASPGRASPREDERGVWGGRDDPPVGRVSVIRFRGPAGRGGGCRGGSGGGSGRTPPGAGSGGQVPLDRLHGEQVLRGRLCLGHRAAAVGTDAVPHEAGPTAWPAALLEAVASAGPRRPPSPSCPCGRARSSSSPRRTVSYDPEWPQRLPEPGEPASDSPSSRVTPPVDQQGPQESLGDRTRGDVVHVVGARGLVAGAGHIGLGVRREVTGAAAPRPAPVGASPGMRVLICGQQL